MEKVNKLNGLYAAVVTPMQPDGDIDLEVIDPYAEFLIDKGVQGVFVNGSTGEGLLLTNEERMLIAERWMKFSGKLAILVHVGSTCYKTAGELARHAERIGVRAISAMGPCFMQPGRVSELVSFNKRVASYAPETPFYYYHVPGRSGVNLSMAEFLASARSEIPNLAGIKFTSYNTSDMLECISMENGRYDILHGHDETIVTGLELGATGGIGTSYNIIAPVIRSVFSKFYSGDIAGAVEMQHYANQFITKICKTGNIISAVKVLLDFCGIPCGPCRLPLGNLSEEQVSKLLLDCKPFIS